MRLRVATYNIHKCKGLDGRTKPDRIVAVLRELNADVIALQEVVNVESTRAEDHQGQFLADELGLGMTLGEVRSLNGGGYGNVTLSRWPVVHCEQYDLTVRGQEPRGLLRTDLKLPDDRCVHLFNVHLGTSFLERRQQGRRLTQDNVLQSSDLQFPRVLMGDFNEWTRGLASQLLSTHLVSADIKTHLQRGRTYPGVFPVWHLDHVYHDPELRVERMQLHKTRLSLLASDHLPLVADLVWEPVAEGVSRLRSTSS